MLTGSDGKGSAGKGLLCDFCYFAPKFRLNAVFPIFRIIPGVTLKPDSGDTEGKRPSGAVVRGDVRLSGDADSSVGGRVPCCPLELSGVSTREARLFCSSLVLRPFLLSVK